MLDGNPLRARIREALAGVRFGCSVAYWDGTEDRFGVGQVARLVFTSPARVDRILADPRVELRDAYVDGELLIEGDFRAAIGGMIWPIEARLLVAHSQPPAQPNTPELAQANVRHHYDLGNDFFRLWLDQRMTYSCAYFASPEATLEQAQVAKVDLVCRKLRLAAGERLLDIGCGWGHLLFHAVERYGVRAHGITLSREQQEQVSAEIVRRGLSERCTVELADYRSVTGTFDKIASIGMFEHVGKSDYALYMRRTSELLAPGGLTLLHTIGKPQPGVLDPWVERNIFPGAHIPDASEIFNAVATTDLVPHDLENLRVHYARTLRLWLERFDAVQPAVRALGFDDRFVRMWRTYLMCGICAFDAGFMLLYQVLMVKGVNNQLPWTRADLQSLGVISARP